MIHPIWHLSTLSDYQPDAQRATEAARDVSVIEDRLERLALICMAMWSLVQSRTDLTEDDLLERVKAIDMLDGVPDGAITRQVTRCSRCDRPMSSRHQRCIYCGSDRLVASAFDTV